MRLFCDENIRDTTTEWLRALGHDAVSVKEVGYAGMDDSVVFNYAVAENRMLLTFNADFSDIRALAAVDHPGIIRLRFKIQTEEVVHPPLERALKELQHEDTSNLLVTVDRDKLRRRRSRH